MPRQVDDILRYEEQKKIYEERTTELQPAEAIYTELTPIPLAKEYTYEDLQNRAKRMLESLYIKDGW